MYEHQNQVIYQQATSNQQEATMASRSSAYDYSPSIGTMQKTYRKLTVSWDAKTGSRDHRANIFCNTTRNYAVMHVPAILLAIFNDLHEKSDMIKELHSVNTSGVILGDDNQTLWLYTMRPSDAMPKNAEELERLYTFVRMFAEKHLDKETYGYIINNIHIAVSFFVWFFTKQNFYYYTKEIRQTTRGGIQKQWRSILLLRVPVVNVIQNTTAPKVRGDVHQKTILVKLENEQSNLKTDITRLISSNVNFDDAKSLHKTISHCTTSGNNGFVGNKQGKKLQKVYDDYVKVTDKIARIRKGLLQNNLGDKKVSLSIKIPSVITEGVNTMEQSSPSTPPSPPKLIRQNADYIGITDANTETVAPLDDNEVPESWEDL
jgi:hypothetical protein